MDAASYLTRNNLQPPQTLAEDRALVCTAMTNYVQMFSCPYGLLEDTTGLENSQWTIAGETQFVCVDPPYNVRRIRGADNAEYDK